MDIESVKFKTSAKDPANVTGGFLSGKTDFASPEYSIELVGSILSITDVKSGTQLVYPFILAEYAVVKKASKVVDINGKNKKK